MFSCIASCLCIRPAYCLKLLCFIECMFGWSIALLCDHCSHFYMTVLVYDQVVHMFHIMFTWSQFTCYIILVLLLLALPWESNVFCASVSGYKYISSKCITASHHFEGEKLQALLVYIVYDLCLLCGLCPCCFCKFLGFVFMKLCRLYGLYHALCSLYALLNQYF